MQPPKSKICVLCGVMPAKTMDHVPPKGFFKGVVNAQLRTVPACRTCNNGASSDDEDLRFYISVQVGKENPASKKLWEDGAHKSILRKTKLRKAFLSTVKKMPVVSEDGSSTTRIAFILPAELYKRVFERTTRGLYFYHTGRILPDRVPVSVNMLAGTPKMETEEIRLLNMHTIGDGAFIYRFGVAPDDLDSSSWIYEFHHAHWAVVTTGALVE